MGRYGITSFAQPISELLKCKDTLKVYSTAWTQCSSSTSVAAALFDTYAVQLARLIYQRSKLILRNGSKIAENILTKVKLELKPHRVFEIKFNKVPIYDLFGISLHIFPPTAQHLVFSHWLRTVAKIQPMDQTYPG